MSTRVSSTQIVNSSLSGIEDAYSRFDAAQRKVNTGKQLTTSSDDPTGTAQTLEFHERASELDQYGRTISQAQNFLSTSESALSNVSSLAQQARTLALQGASDGIGVDARASLGNQIDNILKQVATTANTMYGTRYVFSGQRTDTAPLVNTGTGYQYVGGTAATNDADLTLTIGRNDTIKTNVTGDQIFVPLLTALGKLRDDVTAGAATTVSNVDLSQLDTQLNTVLTARADMGSKIQRLTKTTMNNSVTQLNYTKFISNIEDADVPSSIIEMQTAQTAYQAALQSTARTFQNSLLDFIK
jgi:flagellar hook-associated protein 3 FlgL